MYCRIKTHWLKHPKTEFREDHSIDETVEIPHFHPHKRMKLGTHTTCYLVSFFFIAYRILLFSVKPQYESAIGIHISPPF